MLAKRIYSFVFILFVYISNINAQSAWGTLASPIKLNSDTTSILLSDYFPYNDKIDSVALPLGLNLVKLNEQELIINGSLQNQVSYIRFIIKKEYYDIPVFASEKENIQLNIQLANPVKNLAIKGSFNSWALQSNGLEPIGPVPSKIWTVDIKGINKGRHEYKLVGDGIELNPVNSEIVPNGLGGTNAILKVGTEPNVDTRIGSLNFDASKIIISAQNINGYYTFWNHHMISSSNKSTSKIQIEIPIDAKKVKRSYIRVYGYSKGNRSNDLLIPLEYGKVISSSSLLDRADLHNQIMYFMMVDRFYNGDKSNDINPLPNVHPKANFMGGDIAGIEQKIKEGYFHELGFNTLWLSPIAKNPDGAWGYWNKNIETRFSSYHGYWPTSYSLVDKRFGTNTSFKQMINTAHSNDVNIVLDFVAHHIHTDHPLFKQKPNWVTNLYLPDGTLNTERWDDHRLTTWFDTFLPTLDFQKPEVNETISDSVMFWVRNFDIDGFRHDASKHVPEVFWRTLTKKIRIETLKNNRSFYQIGETYGSAELISSYVNSGQMDAQFDFNLYDAAITAFAYDTKPDKKDFEQLLFTIKQSEKYYGSHHLMGNISGNQDKPRFISIADGSVRLDEDTKLAGWTREIKNQSDIGFQRLAQLHAFNFSVPGIPVVYYGDEIGLPGGNDPDNRRMMKFENLNESERQLKETVQQLANIRKENLEFIYGELKILESTPGYLAIERNYFGKKSIIVFSKDAGKVNVKVSDNRKLKTYFNHKVVQLKEEIILDMSNNDFEIIKYE